MAKLKELPKADIYDWSSGHHRVIRDNLNKLRIEIAGCLQIDPQEQQLIPVSRQFDASVGRSVAEYIKQRNQPAGMYFYTLKSDQFSTTGSMIKAQ